MPPLDVALPRSVAGAPVDADARATLLDGLDPSQRAAVVETARPLAILAGAGSGKTRVLTRRIAWHAATGQIDLDRVLAVTFTRKAAGELVRRLERLPGGGRVTAGTFHALALAQLRRRWQERGHDAPTLLERKARVLVPLMGDDRDAIGRAAAVAGEIEWAKARLIDADHYVAAVGAERRVTALRADDVAALYAGYEQHKHRRRLVDFDDLISLCVRALEGDDDFAAAQRFRFRHFFVDEFQDVTPAQLRLLRAWLGDRDALCVVGDPDQAIYRFTGAEPDFLTRFDEHFPGATVVRLDRNYRSTGQVLAAARAALPTSAGEAVRAVRPDGPVPTFSERDTDRDEARAVAQAVRTANAAGRPWSTMAVLYRTNAQSALFEEALARADVPVRVRGGSRFLDRPEVAAMLELLTESGRRGRGRRFADHLVDLDADAAAMPEQFREHAAAIVTLGREYLTHDGGGGSVDGFLAWLRATLRSGDAGLDGTDAVDLLTFHRAKGLEYETVFVCGVERGFVPISHATAAADLDEERRLLYVALSRASTMLHVSWARQRTLGTRVVRRDPSPWLAAIVASSEGGTDDQARSRPEEPPAALRRARALLASRSNSALGAGSDDVSAVDDRLLGELHDWRGTVARAAAVPTFAVASDSTLRAIAAARPESAAALAEVPGIGRARLERYGPSILAIVAGATTP
jgi:DNA helicase-2/ATP-dependent DNA helicase PcrA